MIRSKKGVIGLPIKLTVSFLVLALMVPPIMLSVESIRDDMASNHIIADAEELGDLIDMVSKKGSGYRMHHELSIEEGGYLTIGGADGYIIRASFGDDTVSKILLDRPVCSEELTLFGTVVIELSSDPEGVSVRKI